MFRGPGYPITSTGVVNCLGVEGEPVRKRVRAGESGLVKVTLFEQFAALPYLGVVGAVSLAPSGDAACGERPRQEQLANAAMLQVQSSTLAACNRWGSARVGLILGTSTGGIAASERAYFAYREQQAIPTDYSFEKQHAFDGVAHLLARKLNIGGPTYVVSTACSSSAKALAAGGRLIASGVCDAVLVGGVDSLCLTTLLGFQSLGLVDAESCRPFAAERRGMSIGEGAAFLLIEREGKADAFLLSVGETSDAHHMAHPHPQGVGAELAMRQAIEAAGIAPEQIDYINAHGTGTALNDAIEARAIERVFGGEALVSSTKGLTGHLLGACGATEAFLCVSAIEQAQIPGNGNHEVDSELAVAVAKASTSRPLGYVLSNSLAFGGSNASVLLASASHVDVDARVRRPTAEVGSFAELFQAVEWSETDSVAHGPGLLSSRVWGRASQLTRMFAALLEKLSKGGFDAAGSPIIYGSAYGEMATTMELLELQARSGQSSPLRFQLSVHNTAAGLLSIALRNRGFSSSIAAGTNTFAMAMLEGIVYLNHSGERELAVVVADEASVSPLSSKRHGPLGAGFHLRRCDLRHDNDCLLVGVPRPTQSRYKGALQGPLNGGTAPDQNPVADALALVEAFRSNEPGELLLGSQRSDADALCTRAWSLELRRAATA